MVVFFPKWGDISHQRYDFQLRVKGKEDVTQNGSSFASSKKKLVESFMYLLYSLATGILGQLPEAHARGDLNFCGPTSKPSSYFISAKWVNRDSVWARGGG